METIVWTSALSVGVDRIDKEHQALVAMLNEVNQAIDSGQGDVAVAGVVGKMRRYAQEHFRTEESAMTDTRYPARESHMIEHDAFIEKMLDMEQNVGRPGSVSASEVRDFLRHWLMEHIQGTDKLLGKHICASAKG